VTGDVDATLEVATKGRKVLLRFTVDGETCPFWMELDEARDLVNSIGQAIRYVTTGVMAK
jgi:hypothetical protein